MNAHAVSRKFTKIVATQFGVDCNEISGETRFIEDLGADSLDLVEIVMSTEDAFDVDLDDERVSEIFTVGDACAYVREKVQGK